MEIVLSQNSLRKIVDLTQTAKQLDEQNKFIIDELKKISKNQSDIIETLIECNGVDPAKVSNLKLEGNKLIFDVQEEQLIEAQAIE